MKKTVWILFAALWLGGVGCKQHAAPQTAPEETEPSAYTIKSVGMVSNDSLLASITRDYRGQVVLLDFWATWCGPCRMAMKSLDPLKPQWQKKGVKFVYVTGESSPLDTWKGMLPGIAGDHYRLTAEQWEALCTQLGIVGIPCYLILNKDGSTAFSNLTSGGYPGNEVIEATLQAATARK